MCTPDIQYKVGHPGPSAYNCVVSAVQYLNRMPWVDSKRVGVQGHSFGGYEVNYLITHCHLFAAACAASGVSDLISSYANNLRGGYPIYHTEYGQGRIGATLWQRPDLYILNSPIFKADQVTTPLLMMQNKEDGAVPYAQGVELFTSLRRLGKRAWLLQYDGNGHSLNGGAASEDYTIRMTQFFDHYLKGAPAPKWMLEGIPVKRKGKENGFDLVKEKDSNGHWITPPQGGLLTEEEQKKVEALGKRKPVRVTIE